MKLQIDTSNTRCSGDVFWVLGFGGLGHCEFGILVLFVMSDGNMRFHDAWDLQIQGLGVWCLVGNGGMDYGDYYWGLYRDYHRDPFPHSLLSTRQLEGPFEELP